MAALLERITAGFRMGEHLPAEHAEEVLDALITETDEPLIAGVFTAWNGKGIHENEIFEFARIMRSRMTRVNGRYGRFVDIVGTGGSSAKTFNVSTAASFVVAGTGIPVAKHGNKAATSKSGSADVLSEIGINPAVDPPTAERCLNEIGLCFMFAPNFHRLSPTLGKVRRGLEFPTIFNCVGPLCNPASPPHQLIGVWDEELVPKMAAALLRLGTKRSWVVHGRQGLDEIALEGSTIVVEVSDALETFEVSAQDFGFEPTGTRELKTDGPWHSAEMIRNTLLGAPHVKAAEDIVLLNAAAAIFISGAASSYLEAASMASQSLRSGAAQVKLVELAQAIPS